MASPAIPLTPPAEPPSTQTFTQSQSLPNTSSINHTQSQPTTTTQTSATTRVEALLASPLTSLTDDGTSRRPRDHRLIHLLLASHGVTAYQERVPLQLMDFAYRHTSTILSDALHMQMEATTKPPTPTPQAIRNEEVQRAKVVRQATRIEPKKADVSLAALRMALAGRTAYQFTGQANQPKEYLKSLADERNRISLGQHAQGDGEGITIGGVKLPHERYCLSGMGWGLKNEWESDGEDDSGVGEDMEDATIAPAAAEGEGMQVDDEDEEMGEDEDGEGNMEDLFGASEQG
ncbi:Transcription initiation factor TFIID subunit 9 [Cyphellophora attinorum]|uniref:Transcription initiation factor TFIID subunit 9 n=1 Tax=Cyphellophora attinorum TaxID=1664694 RepID=A0A0N0NLA2_9EURO|nr:Transcription initiation factor TFIID subunit 9 [Phialophora attinorum]KPI38948.1 Transcription initiation factor TFIID subunit 9 [Phialophora attinorum]